MRSFQWQSASLAVLLTVALLIAPTGARGDGVILKDFVRATNGGVQLRATGAGGMVCALQKTGNLQDWRTLDFAYVAAGDSTFQDPAAALAGNRVPDVKEPIVTTNVESLLQNP